MITALESHSIQCRDVISKNPNLKIATFAAKGSSEEFDYLETLMHSLYDELVFEFRVKKLGYEGLEGLKLTPAQTVRIMVQFLNHRYTHVVQQSLEAGFRAFEEYEGSGASLSSREQLAKALIVLHTPEKSGGGVTRALRLLRNQSSSQALWHRAEMYYKNKDFMRAKKLLVEIQERGEQSVQLTEALNAVEISSRGGVFPDIMAETGFDHTQWGPYW